MTHFRPAASGLSIPQRNATSGNGNKKNSLMLNEGLAAEEESQRSGAGSWLLVNEPSLDGEGGLPSRREATTMYATNLGSSSCEHVTGHLASRGGKLSAEMAAVERRMCTVERVLLDGAENREQSEVARDDHAHAHHRPDSLACPATQHPVTYRRAGCDKRQGLLPSAVAGSRWADTRRSQVLPLFHAPHRQCFCSHGSSNHCAAFSRPQKELSLKRKHETSSRLSCPLDEDEVSPSLSTKRHRTECACAIMEGSFLRMAEAAYTNIGKREVSVDSFEQFKQTNSLLKESADLIGHIKHICERWAHVSA